MSSDTNGNTIYVARVYNGFSWTICKANTYNTAKKAFLQINSAKYNNGDVIFDDGTKPSVSKSSTAYKAPSTGITWKKCGGGGGFDGYAYGDNGSWYAIYRCSICGEQFSGEAGNGNTEHHSSYYEHVWGEYTDISAQAATRSYSITWKNRLSTVTLTENSMNSNNYSSKTFNACLFSKNGTLDSIVTINPNNTVEIKWFAAGIDSGYCDKTWTF